MDVETSDLDPDKGHIVEVGLCPIIEKRKLPAISTLVKPPKGTRIAKDAVAVHGISAQKLRNKPGFEQAWEQLMSQLEEIAPSLLNPHDNVPLVAHNADFDRAFILSEANRMANRHTVPGGHWLRKETQWIDTLAMLRRDQPQLTGFGLDRMASCCGVQITGTRHTAATDVEVLADCVRNWPAPGTSAGVTDLFAVPPTV